MKNNDRFLSPDLDGYPADLEMFIQDIQRNRWDFGYERNHTLAIESARNIGNFPLSPYKKPFSTTRRINT
jgi:hypothetical protein